MNKKSTIIRIHDKSGSLNYTFNYNIIIKV